MTDFPSSLTGQPSLVQRQIRPQTNFDEKDHANTFRDFEHNGGQMPISLQNVPVQLIAGGQGPAPLAGKRGIDAFSFANGDVNPGDRAQLMLWANLCGKYENEDNTTWRRWSFGLSEPTTADRYLELREDSDAILRHAAQNGRVFGANFAAEPNGNFAVNFNGAFGRYDFFESPTQTAGSGSDLPTVLGYNTGTDLWDDTVDSDVYIRIDSVSSNDITYSVKVGSAASYPSSPASYTMGTAPVRMTKDGVQVGSQGTPLLLYFAAGSTLTASDEFRLVAPIVRWSQTLPTRRIIPAVNTQLYLNGSEVSAEGGWSVSIEWENTGIAKDTSKEEGGTPFRRGKLIPTLQISREVKDVVLAKIAHERTTVAAVIEGTTDAEITSGVPYRFRFVMPAGTLAGDLFSPNEGASNTDESYTIVGGTPTSAYSWDGESYSDNFTVEIHTDLTAL